jgi:uncharacterized protein YlxW (UPF0749 family)
MAERPRPDASMTLLTEVMERPLDAGYALAAARRGHEWRPRRSARSVTAVVTAVVAAVCGLLTTWSVAELRRPEPVVVGARRALEAEIARRTDLADRTQAANAVARERIAATRREALAQRVDALAAFAGELSVQGPGVQVELSDDRGVQQDSQPEGAERGRVLDHDLQVLVNALWASGAEAIAVNGHRLSAVTAIRRAGRAVLVGLQPVLPPYRIQAIGDPERLAAELSGGSAAAYLDVLGRDGIGSAVTDAAELRLPGAADRFAPTFARAQGPATDGAP